MKLKLEAPKAPTGIYFLISAGMLITTALIGLFFGGNHAFVEKLFQNAYGIFDRFLDSPSWVLFLLIFLNNAFKALLVILFGFCFGIFPAYSLLMNGFFLGAFARYAAEKQSFLFAFVGIAPHGIVELSAFVLAGAYGLWLGYCFFRKIRYGEAYWPHLKSALIFYLKIVLPLILVAALVEAFLTTRLIETVI